MILFFHSIPYSSAFSAPLPAEDATTSHELRSFWLPSLLLNYGVNRYVFLSAEMLDSNLSKSPQTFLLFVHIMRFWRIYQNVFFSLQGFSPEAACALSLNGVIRFFR
jgi:hypothetical protein